MSRVTPFQTIGPFFDVLLRTRAPSRQTADPDDERRIVIEGVLFDGDGQPVGDGLIETWQADASGRYGHPEDPRAGEADATFFGYGWCHTDDGGRFRFETLAPGPVPAPGLGVQAPHIVVSVMARGILTRYVTRIYFEGDGRNEADPVLAMVPPERRATLLARPTGERGYRFDIHLQGPQETVFFDV